MARKTAVSAPAPTASGPRKETLEFAKKVVKLRDKDGLAWAAVAAALNVPYDHNGSSRLRRAYILGSGKTVGVRTAAKSAPAPKKRTAPRKRTAAPKGTRSVRKVANEK